MTATDTGPQPDPTPVAEPQEDPPVVSHSCLDGAWPCYEHDEHVRLPTAAVEVIEQARLVSQWHNAMNSGPPGVLNGELGELRKAVEAMVTR